MKFRIAFSFICAGLALSGPAPAWAACEAGGIGGTGVRAEGGIGGTGARAEGGIGGTGVIAGGDELGLVGVITGFGSICVNGVEVHYDSSTPVTFNGQPGAADALALGQTVAVRAVGAGAEARARAISVLDAAVGPVTAVDRAAGTLQVVGQSVRLAQSTVFGPGLTADAVRGASAGDTLRVSGLRRADGVIVATRVERASPGNSLVYGSLALDAAGVPRVGGMRIEAADAALRELSAASGPVLVTGRAGEGRLVAVQVTADPLGSSLAPGRFVAQVYVDEVQPERRLRAGGLQFSLDAPGAGALGRDRLVRLYGRTEADGRRVVERFDLLAEPLNPRPQAAPAATAPRAEGERRGRSGAEGGDDSRGRSGSSDRGPDRSGSGSSGSDRPDRPDRVDRPDRGGRPDRVERIDRGGPH
jgi:uncharacterized protein DUF5666